MLGNFKNQPQKLIDEKQIAALAVDYGPITDARIADSVRLEAIEYLIKDSGLPKNEAQRQVLRGLALAAVFNAGRVQGIREERARRAAK